MVVFNDTATTEIYTLSLHDALPISSGSGAAVTIRFRHARAVAETGTRRAGRPASVGVMMTSQVTSPRSRTRRSAEHTSELQSRQYLVCRLLLEKKNI